MAEGAPPAAQSSAAGIRPQARFADLAIHPSRPNRTGLPDGLKSGIEALSGMSMDGVRVHYNSARPRQLDALALAQGREIHLAAGQEHHLPHEAWHIVQQAQGRVRPTVQAKTGESVNDDQALEREADVMGARALNYDHAPRATRPLTPHGGKAAQCMTARIRRQHNRAPTQQEIQQARQLGIANFQRLNNHGRQVHGRRVNVPRQQQQQQAAAARQRAINQAIQL